MSILTSILAYFLHRYKSFLGNASASILAITITYTSFTFFPRREIMKRISIALIPIILIVSLFTSCFDAMPVAPTDAEKGYINSAILAVTVSEIYFGLQAGSVPGMSITISEPNSEITWNNFDMNIASSFYVEGETMVSGTHKSDSSVSENDYNITIQDNVYPNDYIHVILRRNADEITYLKLNGKVLDPSGWNPES